MYLVAFLPAFVTIHEDNRKWIIDCYLISIKQQQPGQINADL